MKLFRARPTMLGFWHHSMYTYIYLSNFQPLLNLNLSWPWEIAKVIVLQCQVLSRALRIHSGAFGKQKCLHKSFMMFSFLHVFSKLIIRVQVALGYMFYVNMVWLDERCPDILNTSGDWWLFHSFHSALLIKSFMFFPADWSLLFYQLVVALQFHLLVTCQKRSCIQSFSNDSWLKWKTIQVELGALAVCVYTHRQCQNQCVSITGCQSPGSTVGRYSNQFWWREPLKTLPKTNIVHHST